MSPPKARRRLPYHHHRCTQGIEAASCRPSALPSLIQSTPAQSQATNCIAKWSNQNSATGERPLSRIPIALSTPPSADRYHSTSMARYSSQTKRIGGRADSPIMRWREERRLRTTNLKYGEAEQVNRDQLWQRGLERIL